MIDEAIIDISDVQKQLIMKDTKNILKDHPYKIWEGSDNRWKTYIDDDTKASGRRLISKVCKDNLIEVIVNDYKINHPTDTSIKTLYNEWIQFSLEQKDFEKNTADRYQNDYDRFIRRTDFEKMKIEDITPHDIIKFLKAVINKQNEKKGITRKAFSNLKSLIKGVYSYAISERELKCISISHTFKDLKIPDKKFKKSIIKDSEQVFNEDEALLIANHILSNYKNTRELGILLALLTGLRVGELSSLKSADQEKNILYIQRTEIKYKDEYGKTIYEVRDFPKTESSLSGINLTDSAVNILKLIRKENLKNGVNSEYLFYEFIYGRLKTYFFNKTLKIICKKVDIPVRSMHKLRKTYASYLLANGVEEKIAQSQLRHKDGSTTRKHYDFSIRNNKYKQEELNRVDLLKKCNQV